MITKYQLDITDRYMLYEIKYAKCIKHNLFKSIFFEKYRKYDTVNIYEDTYHVGYVSIRNGKSYISINSFSYMEIYKDNKCTSYTLCDNNKITRCMRIDNESTKYYILKDNTYIIYRHSTGHMFINIYNPLNELIMYNKHIIKDNDDDKKRYIENTYDDIRNKSSNKISRQFMSYNDICIININ